MDAGSLLRETRRERGLDQAGLARRAGTTQSYVSRVERGAVAPSLKTLRRLLNAMGVDLRLQIETLSPGNVPAAQLRSDLRDLSPEQRLDHAIELSEFLTDVAAATSARSRRSDG
jgi:transcriptional regulator with XRE-family HTH domain